MTYVRTFPSRFTDLSVHVWDESFENANKLYDLPFDKVPSLSPHIEEVRAAYKYLASAIRNRDAHRYERDVRAGHFLAVPLLFIPAFNALLATLDEASLKNLGLP